MIDDSVITQATSKAISLLEVSIATLCQTLGLDVGSVMVSFEIPVTEEHQDYRCYESLSFMISNLKNLR